MPENTANHTAYRQELDEWRKKIDTLDQQLSTLLCERLECAVNIIALKSKMGEQVLQPEREQEVLNNVLGNADSPLKSKVLENIYRSIMEETRLLQHEWQQNKQ